MGNELRPPRATSFDSGSFRKKYGMSGSGGLDSRRMSPGIPKRKHGISIESTGERDDYGWFEDFESPALPHALSHEFSMQPLQKALTLPAPATEPPLYVLECSLETQQLWYTTAGRRPKQPVEEREYFEKLWIENFEQSGVKYEEPNIETRVKKLKQADCIPLCEVKGEILFRGKAPFSNSVSKSFFEGCVASMNVHMPYFRILRSLTGDIFAEFLIVVTLSSNSAPVTFGIWKRFSDFNTLANTVIDINVRSGPLNQFKNAVLSWQCVLQRKRWIRSLDKDYLALKCFLLERFVHDVLFETQSPAILSKFLGLEQ